MSNSPPDPPEDPFGEGPQDPFGDQDPLGSDEPQGTDPFAANWPGGNPFGGPNPLFDPSSLLGGPEEQADMLGELTRMLGAVKGFDPSATREMLAVATASEGKSEHNVDPLDRQRFEELANTAKLHVATVTGLAVPTVEGALVEPATRAEWVRRTVSDLKDHLDALSDSISLGDTEPESPDDPLPAMLAQVGPMLTTMTTGAVVGRLGRSSFGHYDVPLPRPLDRPIQVITANLDEFAKGWGLSGEELRTWVCLQEVAYFAVLAIPHVRKSIDSLVHAYLAGFQTPDGDFASQAFDDTQFDPESLARMLSDPDALLGVLRSPAQREILPLLEARMAVLVGYVDHVMDQVGSTLISSYSQMTEALRRRRVEVPAQDRFGEKIFGLELDREQCARGRAFVNGVLERAGNDGLARLWDNEEFLPTPAEVDAPGLWLERIALPGLD